MIFQQFNLVERLDVITNVLVGRLAGHGPLDSLLMRFSDAERTLAIRALDRLDLAAQALQRAGTLSGGQQQRVAIARALASSPRLLIADEPTGNLDSKTAHSILALFRTIVRERNVTMLMATHDTLADEYVDRIINLSDGHIISS